MFMRGHMTSYCSNKRIQARLSLITSPCPNSTHFLCNKCNACILSLMFSSPLDLKLKEDIAWLISLSLQLCDLGLITQHLCDSGFALLKWRQQKQLTQGFLGRRYISKQGTQNSSGFQSKTQSYSCFYFSLACKLLERRDFICFVY